jgi:hypothetical protein
MDGQMWLFVVSRLAAATRVKALEALIGLERDLVLVKLCLNAVNQLLPVALSVANLESSGNLDEVAFGLCVDRT